MRISDWSSDVCSSDLHHPDMTQARLEELGREAVARWGLLSVRIIHRVGSLVPGDRIVFVATAARHRTEALESCAFLIDWLKTSAPFWKRESFAAGRNHGVELGRESWREGGGLYV